MEDALRDSWAAVLDMEASEIQDELDFFKQAGGDSVMAIKLTNKAQKNGIKLNAQQVFVHPTFGSMKKALQAAESSSKGVAKSTPLPDRRLSTLDAFKAVRDCLVQCNVDGTLLEDIRPCAPFQEELMRASHSYGVWTFQMVMQISRNAEARVKEIINLLHQRDPTFRYRIAQHNTDLYALQLKGEPTWEYAEMPLAQFRAQDYEKAMRYGDLLSRCSVLHDGDETYIFWTQSHALYDRWSKMNVIEDIHSAFQDFQSFKTSPLRPPLTDFLDHVEALDSRKATDHWKKQLEGLDNYRPLFDVPPNRVFKTGEHSVRKHMEYRRPKNTNITFATVAQTAWALVLARECTRNDVFFTLYRSCRQMNIADVDSIIGPLWTLVPFRSKLSGSQSLDDLLQKHHSRMIEGIEHEPFGPTAMNEYFGHKGFLQTALLVQPPQPETFNSTVNAIHEETKEKMSLRLSDHLVAQTRNHIGFYIMMTPKGEELELWTRYDPSVIDEDRVGRLLDKLKATILEILEAKWTETKISKWLSEDESARESDDDEAYNLNIDTTKPSTLTHLFPPGSESALACVIPGEIKLEFTYQELDRHIQSFQQSFADAGITHKSAVSMSLGNTYELVVAFQGATRQRAIAAPLNPGYKQEEFEFYIDDLGSALLLIPKDQYDDSDAAVRAARKYNAAIAEVYFDSNADKVVLDIKEQGKLEGQKGALLTAQEDDVALVLHTSGTTGRPKAVPLSHKNLITSVNNICTTYRLRPKDRTLLIMPLFHVHGLLASFLSPLRSGGGAVIPERLTPDFWKQFKDNRATWYSATPTMHRMILNFPLPDSGLPNVRFIRSCSSQLSPALFDQLVEKFRAPVLESYAMTEASHMMTSNPLAPGKQLPGSVGQPQNLDVKILTDDGDELPQGSEGEVCIRGKNVTAGYLNNDEANAKSFTDEGFFRTGDQGKFNEDGYLILTGRLKELINKGGEKISPVELDNVVSQHESVQECVCFAVDDEDYGQEVGAAIKVKDGKEVDAKELRKWIGEKVAAHKVPKKIWFPAEIPKTATGKVQRKLVAEKVSKEKPA